MSTLLFLESWDHSTQPQDNWKWNVPPGGTRVAGRTGFGHRFGAADGWPVKTFNAEYAKMTLGCAHNTTAYANTPLRLTTTAGYECNLQHVGNGKLRINFHGIVISPDSTFVMNINQWYYLELQAELTTGSPPHIIASARVNGAEIISWDSAYSGAVTKFSGISLVPPGGGNTSIYDDLYVTDDEFLGDIRIGVLYPNAPGDSVTWTPSGAGANWQQVEEHPPDSDTSYVSAASTGLKDLYNIDNIDPAFTGAIKGAQALWAVKKSDEGDAAVKGLWKSGATEITQTHGHNYLAPYGYHPSAASYSYNIQPERKSLFTGSDWSAAEVNGLMLGITRTL